MTKNNRVGATPYPFEPSGGITIAVTSTTGSAALAGTGEQALVTNLGTVPLFVEFGTSAVTATTASLCVLPQSQVLVTLPETSAGVRATHAAVISTSLATTSQISTGWGV